MLHSEIVFVKPDLEKLLFGHLRMISVVMIVGALFGISHLIYIGVHLLVFCWILYL